MRLTYGAFSMSVDGEPTQVSHVIVKKHMVQYMRPHGRFAHCSCETYAVLASYIELYCFLDVSALDSALRVLL